MRKLLLTTAAIFTLGATAAFAELSTQQIVDMFPGAAKIEIKRGTTTTKVEVIVGNEKIEVVFNNADDTELSRETVTLTDEQLAAQLNGDDSSDDGDDDSSDDGDDDNGDDENDDSEDDDGEDDHGSNDDEGGDENED